MIVPIAALILLTTACGDLLSSDTTSTTSSGPADPARLCPVVEEWRPILFQAESNADLPALVQAKLSYYSAVRPVTPSTWVDNIDVIVPAWETLRSVVERAEGDESLTIDFAAFQRDFAESAANDGAFTTFTNGICPPA